MSRAERPMRKLRGVCIGAGYFSQFHYDAWSRIPEVELTAICDLDTSKAQQVADQYGIPTVYADFEKMFTAEQPDFVDVITPPPTHETVCESAGKYGIHIICQKPLAPSLVTAKKMVDQAREAGVRFMVHENFRFQPWHREIRKLIDEGVIGDTLHSLYFRSRMGDGWGPEAYLGRQPYFRTMPQLLVYETGVHYIDTLRYLAGEVSQVYASLRTLNTVIAGEDCGLLILHFENGAVGVWDANRFNESTAENSRYTFGTFLVEGNTGSIRLYEDGRLTIQQLGETEQDHIYHHEARGFAGDCCYNTQQHFVDCLIHEKQFETDASDYLQVLKIQDAIYRSAAAKQAINLEDV